MTASAAKSTPDSAGSVGKSLATRPCPICQSTDDSHLLADAAFDTAALDSFAFASRKTPEYMHYRLVTCPTCDLAYASPCPSPGALGQAYEEAAFDSGVEAHFAARTYAKALDPFLSRLPNREGALDIGTGDGAFLEELLARQFTAVQGVEPSAAPIAAARADVRPLIRKGLFAESEFSRGTFSLITCFQTLEHVYDPNALCQAALRLLRPGGCVYFVAHNRRGLLNRALGKKSPIFDIEHLQLFSPKSIQQLVERAGFVNCQVQTLRNQYPLAYWSKLLPLPGGIKTMALGALNKTPLAGMPIAANVGNMGVFAFKPLS